MYSARNKLHVMNFDANKLLVPRSCTTSFEPRSFGSSGPTAWNDTCAIST